MNCVCVLLCLSSAVSLPFLALEGNILEDEIEMVEEQETCVSNIISREVEFEAFELYELVVSFFTFSILILLYS